MIKKIILVISIAFIIVFGFKTYNSSKTVECWWGTLYPSLSFVAFEDEAELESKISTLDTHYLPNNIKEEKPIKYKFAIIEWFKEIF